MYALKDIQAIESQPSYKTGEYDYRPWGFYEVLKVGKENNEEFCTKKIGIKPRNVGDRKAEKIPLIRLVFW